MKRILLTALLLLFISIGRAEACNTNGECSYNVGQWIYFKVLDFDDGKTPETTVDYSEPTIEYIKDDGTEGTVTLAANCVAPCASPTDGDWSNTGNGIYRAYEGTTATFDDIGSFTINYSATGHTNQAYGYEINAEDRLATTDFDSTATVATATVDEWEAQSQAAPIGFHTNVKMISDDATSPDNLELMYNGAGYIANSAPASRSQVDGISGGSGGSINREPSYDNTTTDNINSGGAAVDKGGGLVGIPVTGHAFTANLQVTIANTVNYNGSFPVESQTTNEVVITSSFTSETFGADDTIISTIKTIPFIGTVTSGTFANVATEDGVVHDLADDTDVIDIAYGFAIGGGRSASAVTVVANVNGNTDEILIKAYDFVGTAWDTVGVINGSGGSSFIEVDPKLLLRHTGTGSDLGNVFIRLDTDTTTPSQLEVDLLLVSAVSIGQSVGYANGQLWLDTVNGVLGSEPFVNCVADSPCKTIANIKTLSGTVGISDIHVINGSTVLLAESTVNESYFGDNWVLQLGGQDVADAYFQGAHVSGVGVSATEVHFEGCDVETMSVQIGHFDFCSFKGTVTHTLAGDYNYHNSYSKVPGVGGPTFTKTPGQAVTQQWRGWAGSITVSNIEAGDVSTISGTELGDIVLNGVDGTVKILGEYESLTDNRSGGSVVLVLGAFEGSDIDLTLADTNELQGDWVNGGRLDLILDIIAADTTTDIPALIAALNDLSAAQVNAEVASALSTYDPPTRTEATSDKDEIITEVDANEAKIDTANNKILDTIQIIESQRGSHSATGNIFYWGPSGGSDSEDCLTKATRCLTFAYILANKVVANNHDLIIAVADASTAQTVTNEEITISKAYTFLRGPGRDFKIEADSTAADTVTLSAEGTEISGMIVNTAATGAKSAIVATGDFALIHNVWVDQTMKYGIDLNTSSNSEIHDVVVQDAGGGGSDAAIRIKGTTGGDAQRNVLWNLNIINPNMDGIRIDDTDGTGAINNTIIGNGNGVIITTAAGWGINEVNGNENHIVGPNVVLHENASGAYNLTGAMSEAINVDDWSTEAKQDIIDTNVDSILDDTGTGGVVVAAGSKTGYALSTAGVDAILDETVDGTRTLREVLCAMASTQLGKNSGMGTSTVTFRNIDDDADVIVGTMDGSFNRTAVTLTLTGCN